MQQLGISEAEISERCFDLFYEAPIPFKLSDRNQLEEKIATIIITNNFKIPIIHVFGAEYLIGITKKVCELRSDDKIVILNDGKYENFENFLLKNEINY